MSLEAERKSTTFCLQEMGRLLWGGQERMDLFQQMQKLYDEHPDCKFDVNHYNKSREDQLLQTAKTSLAAIEIASLSDQKYHIGHVLCPQVILFSSVHQAMVIPAFEVLASSEQINTWMPRLKDFSALACYAQTELGHGSDVQNLQTTATFDKKTNEFIIHTPSIEATKYWPGDLGLNANHALVFCQLVVGKHNHGVQAFFVQIRDSSTHKPLPQITVGDIGPKIGYMSKDNGYLAFNNYHVPADALLAKYIKVYPNGQVERIGNPKVSYASMMILRKTLCEIYTRFAGQALTIAIRYSLVRTQFKDEKAGQEIKVLDYQTQQDKLFPLLAEFYATIFGGLKVRDLVDENFHKVTVQNDFSMLNLTHAVLSGAKASYTYFITHCSEWCRLSCGGHGFGHYSGLVSIFQENSANITIEGENSILYLQLARFLLKQVKHSQKNPEQIHDLFKCVVTPLENDFVQKCDDITSIDNLQKLIGWNCHILLMSAITKLMNIQGISQKEAWDTKLGISLTRAAQAYVPFFNITAFKEAISTTKNEGVQQILIVLCKLYGIHTLLTNMHGLYLQNQIQGQHIQKLRETKVQLYNEIRPNALGLVEAQGFSDNTLKTLIGCSDGEVYGRLYNFVTKENSVNRRKVAHGMNFIKKMKDASPKL